MQVLVIQAGLAVILLGLAWFSRDNTRNMLLDLATLIVPIGWGYAVYDGFRRDEAARKDGTWSVGFAAKERKRGFGLMGILLVVWVAVCIAIFVLT